MISKLLMFHKHARTHAHTHTHIFIHANSSFSSWYFFPLPQSFFRTFFPIKRAWQGSFSDSEKHNRFYIKYCYFSEEHHKIAQIQQLPSRLFHLLYIKELQNKLQQERYILLSPLNKTFTLSAPHNNYPHPHITGKFRSS